MMTGGQGMRVQLGARARAHPSCGMPERGPSLLGLPTARPEGKSGPGLVWSRAPDP